MAFTDARFGVGDLYWSRRLFEAWQVIGTSALAGEDMARAERYLESAWRGGFMPMAAWSLATIREKQKRPDEAARLWAAVSRMTEWKDPPPEFAPRLAAIRSRAASVDGADVLMKLRTVTLRGAATEDFTSEVVVLVGPDGGIEGARNLPPRIRPLSIGRFPG